MILHYNLYPSNSRSCESIVRFYVSECEPIDIFFVAKRIQEKLDSSIGNCDFLDWQFDTMQGTVRIIMQRGVDHETTMAVMNDLKIKLLTDFNNR